MVGKKIRHLIAKNGELNTVRAKIAHAILEDDSLESFSIDESSHIREVQHWLPFCKSLTIYLLKKEFPQFF